MDFVPAPTVLHSLTRTIYTTLVFLALVAGLPAIAQARTLFVIEGFGWGHGSGSASTVPTGWLKKAQRTMGFLPPTTRELS